MLVTGATVPCRQLPSPHCTPRRAATPVRVRGLAPSSGWAGQLGEESGFGVGEVVRHGRVPRQRDALVALQDIGWPEPVVGQARDPAERQPGGYVLKDPDIVARVPQREP